MINSGDYVKVLGKNVVFKARLVICGLKHKEDGWLVNEKGGVFNYRECEPYKGALSAIPEANKDIDCGYRMEK